MRRAALALALAWLAAEAAAQGGPVAAAPPAVAPPGPGQACVDCHRRASPGVVSDWQLSRHAAVAVDCVACHGDGHRGEGDAARARLPTPETCGRCHREREAQFRRGKHAWAWAAVKAMPTFHYQPLAARQGLSGCASCHKLGLKSEAELRELRASTGGYGVASCDACHTRHLFSRDEARRPEACRSCHGGYDHDQWSLFAGSKHGVRAALRAQGAIPESSAAPTCQTCHMPGGDHEVRSAWGFLGVALPLPDGDPTWRADRATILQAFGALDPAGRPTGRLEVLEAADVLRTTHEAFQAERAAMLAVCQECHAGAFARRQLEQAQALLRDADHLSAEAIRVVANLYQDGTLARPADSAYAFPDLLGLAEPATAVEQRLAVMILEHRTRTFQAAFHSNPDQASWAGWSALRRDLLEIRQLAEELRRAARGGPRKVAPRP